MKGKFWRKALAAALALLIVSGSTPIKPLSQVFDRTTITASAAKQTFEQIKSPITYIGENGEEVTVTDYTVLTGNETANDEGNIELQGGTYVVDGTVNYSNMPFFRGDTTLILKDNANLTINLTNEYKNGITCYDGNNSCSLSVYGQSNGTGELDVSAIGYGIGISCANYKQYGGKVTATAVNNTGINAYYDFMIYGGELTAKSAKTAAINSSTGCIYFNGGTVEATTTSTDEYADAICSKDMHFNSGTVIANGRLHISGTCYLNGGIVKAKSYGAYPYSITGTYSNGTNLYTGEYNFQNHPYVDWWTAFIAEFDGKTLAPAYVVNLPESTTGGSISADKSFVTANAEDKTVTLTVTPDEGYAVKSVSVNGTAIEPVEGVYSFKMPAEDVTVSAEFEQIKSPITYIGADGEPAETTDYTVLTSDSDISGVLPAGWYVVKDNVEYSSGLEFEPGDVHIVLCDGASLNIGTNQSPINDEGIRIYNGNIWNGHLTVYGQSGGTGELNIYSEDYSIETRTGVVLNGGKVNLSSREANALCSDGSLTVNGGELNAGSICDYCIYFGGDITINGGKVTALKEGENHAALYANSTITINEGEVTATATGEEDDGLYSTYCIINGGVVETTGGEAGINARDITLSLTKPTDSIRSNSYYYETVILTVPLTDGTNLYSGTLTAEQISALAGKTLVRAYAVDLPENTTGGSISADKSFVAANAEDKTVTLTVTPDEGYVVKSVKYNDTEITPVNGVYSFTMPAEDVTVSAEFEESKTEPITTQISYVTANGQESEEVTAIVLDENTVIDEDFDWSQPVYYVTGDVVYSDEYFMFSNPNGVTLILADDADLNVDTIMTYHRYEDNSLEYGAYGVIITKAVGAEGVGKISSQIICKNFVQYAGQLTGIVGAFGDSTGEDADYQGTITFDFADESASANIVTYYEEMCLCSSVIIPDGKALTDGTNTYTGILTGDDLKAISGQTLVAAEVENTRNIVNAANITLGGELGLNFYLTIPDDAVTAGAKVVMNGPEGEKEVALSSLSKDDKGRYKLTYKLKAIFVDRKVSLKVVGADDTVLDLYKTSGDAVDNGILEYGIYDYVELSKTCANLTDADKKIIKAMYTYGAYSVQWKYGTTLPDDVDALPEITKEQFEKYALKQSGTNSSITLTGASLVLDSNTAFRLYFNCADDISGHNVVLGENTLNVQTTDTAGRYYVDIENIGAGNLRTDYTVTLDDTYSVTVSAMTYVYNYLKSGMNDEKLCNLLKALYAYSEAVNPSNES